MSENRKTSNGEIPASSTQSPNHAGWKLDKGFSKSKYVVC